MDPDLLDARIREILEYDLNLEGDEMMMPLKTHEIEALGRSIRDLVDLAVDEASR